ncbi:AraC family transcriptional regulator [Coraliomargarita parva]|uniref:AraC family transcriptional regulator n=1 Tax=Coraliomargarita parva TaxID=3014050 RepID=UPI0022B30EB2|nr:AraC family transcriptional regulator [Coraliomargarita parva]
MNAQDNETGIEAGTQALIDCIARLTEQGERHSTAIPGLGLFKRECESEPTTGLYEPSICMVAQGAKHVLLGDDKLVYDPRNYLLTSLHLPTVVQVREASPEKPYYGLRLKLDLKEVAQMMVDSELPAPRAQQPNLGMETGEVTKPLLDAVVRLVQLLEHEEDIPILAPIIQKEIVYRLLIGNQGMRLRQIASSGSQSHQVSKAILWLKDNYTQPLKVDDLAQEVGMSTSTFHHHFRTMTALSPLQYQKQLRLQEARRLMLLERKDAATAAFEVGYESPSQFSREYSRQFGAPPVRDIMNLRQLAAS